VDDFCIVCARFLDDRRVAVRCWMVLAFSGIMGSLLSSASVYISLRAFNN
jgi:hypothetical protein